MAMAIDSRQQQQPFGGMGFDALRYQAPHFTNPWASAPASQGQMYSTSLPTADHVHAAQQQHHQHQQQQQQQQQVAHAHRYAAPAPVAVSSAGYAAGPISAPALSSGILSLGPTMDDLSGLHVAQDGLARSYGSAYSAAAVSAAPPSAATFAAYGYQPDRRPSHPSVLPPQSTQSSLHFPTSLSGNTLASVAPALDEAQLAAASHNSYIDMFDRLSTASEAERQHFSDALDASRGMVAMSQSDITPRNIYGAAPTRTSTDSYGFPSTHSSHSSVSSGSTYPSYYNSSVSEASVGDYSSASESIDIPSSRTLPRPAGLLGVGMPPAPQSMMGQFSSKVSSSSQKKHKCKICDKRFTRPSSLQTHMYSHTGEKPFSCDVAGCGRHFSVVSNLRRHRKVHKAGGASDDHPSPDDDE